MRHLSGHFVLAGGRGFFVVRSCRTTFLLAYLESNWSKRVGFGQSIVCVICALLLRLISRFLWRPTHLAMNGLSDWVSWIVYSSTKPSTHRCRTVCDAQVRELCPTVWLSLPCGASRLVSLTIQSFDSNPSLWYIRHARIINDNVFCLCFYQPFLAEPRLFCLLVLLYWQKIVVCPLASSENSTDPHLWPILSIDGKRYNH
jgi:hypothetical protein